MEKIIKIGLIGHSFCGGNLGLGALAFGELYAIKEACLRIGCDYRITSYETRLNGSFVDDPKVTQCTYDLKNIVKTSKQFSKQDVLIDMSGGDSFADIYGARLYIVQIFIKLAVMLSGRPYILPPQTYGPYNRWWTRLFANFYIKYAKAAFARDTISVDCLSVRNKNRVETIADLGFLMEYTPERKFDQFTVGFNVSGLLYQNEKLLGSNYKKICHAIIEHLLKKRIKVVLVPHVIGFEDCVDNDYLVCKNLAEMYNLDEVIPFASPKDAKAYISKCNFFIGSRMHATIGAVSSGVPTLPLAYSRKFRGVFNLIQYDYTFELNCANLQLILSEIDKSLNMHYEPMQNAVENTHPIIKKYSDMYVNRLVELLK